MKPEELQNEMKVEARFARTDNAAGDGPAWSDWQEVTLFVRRREKTLPRGYNRNMPSHKAGAIIELAAKPDWASYTEDDYNEPYSEWLAEDFRMQLRKIKNS